MPKKKEVKEEKKKQTESLSGQSWKTGTARRPLRLFSKAGNHKLAFGRKLKTRGAKAIKTAR